MTRVVAPCRLHFGLLNVGAAGVGLRQYGGAGLMIDEPGVTVRVAASSVWAGEGPAAERALGFAKQFVGQLPDGLQRPVRVTVERCPPEHVGLGVGTQLGLAVARAAAAEFGMEDLGVESLARMTGRGGRSGIGLHGFDRGGLIIDGGHERTGTVAPMLARYEVPQEWRILLARPADPGPGWSGNRERAAFARPRPPQVTVPLTDRMARLLLLGVLPALLERDCDTFGEALHEYNRLAGRMFAEDQGGDYASSEVKAIVEAARGLGVSGAGQSSWGPTTFAVCEDGSRAAWLEGELTKQFADVVTNTTTGNSGGASRAP